MSSTSTSTIAVASRFVMFGRDHLGALLAIAIGTSCACMFLRPRGADLPIVRRRRRIVCVSLCAALLLYAVIAEFYWISAGWTVQASLPFHLCDLSIFVTAAALWTYAGGPEAPGASVSTPPPPAKWWRIDRHTVYELTYYWGLGGATQALLTPELADPFPTFTYFKFFISHGLVIAAVFVLTLGVRLSPRPGSARRAWLLTNVLVPPMMLFNWITGSNYMYLCGPPATHSIMDYFGPWPLSFLTLELVALMMMGLLYAPFWFRRRRVPNSALS